MMAIPVHRAGGSPSRIPSSDSTSPHGGSPADGTDMDPRAWLRAGPADDQMAAFVRIAPAGGPQDPIVWAEAALREDAAWLRALARGIAQRADISWRALAVLTAWSNWDIAMSQWNTMRPLGQAVGRSEE